MSSAMLTYWVSYGGPGRILLNFFPGFKKSHGQRSEVPQAATKADAGPSQVLKTPKTGQSVSAPWYITRANLSQNKVYTCILKTQP